MACEGRKRAPMQRCADACARDTKPTARSSILVNMLTVNMLTTWGIMIPLDDAAAQRRTQDLVLPRDRAVSRNRNAMWCAKVRTFGGNTFNIITIIGQIRARDRKVVNMLRKSLTC